MILSYHPCFVAHQNLICAGREPDDDDLAAIRAADAVVLPQGCCRALYQMAAKNCRHVFPNFDARFKYPGKIGQISLFRETNTAHPATETFVSLDAFYKRYGRPPRQTTLKFPLVFKFGWGGEGDHVYLLKSGEDLNRVLQLAANFENTGRFGFMVQKYIPAGNRTLRVAVIGQALVFYWRIQNDTQNFRSNLAQDAVIDTVVDPDLQHAVAAVVNNFCAQTGINLAGFDVVFLSESSPNDPLLLEINYYFGRGGLGGSERFYEMLNSEILKWLDSLGLSL